MPRYDQIERKSSGDVRYKAGYISDAEFGKGVEPESLTCACMCI
jgi:hypothetical protein